MTRLARHTATALRRGGTPAAVAYPLAARPRADSTALDAGERLVAAAQAFAVRPARLPKIRAAAEDGVHLLLLDDVMTTGATLAAAADRLGRGGLDVTAAAVLGATRRRNG
jgi:predicted amidophosphoribosyltransferase